MCRINLHSSGFDVTSLFDVYVTDTGSEQPFQLQLNRSEISTVIFYHNTYICEWVEGSTLDRNMLDFSCTATHLLLLVVRMIHYMKIGS